MVGALFWPVVVFVISLIIFITDIIWQFWVAGMYAPKKARGLIVEDPLFQELDKKINQFTVTVRASINRLDMMKKEIQEIRAHIDIKFHNLNTKIKVIDNSIPRMDDIDKELVSMRESIRGTITGLIGYNSQESLDNLPLPEIAEESAYGISPTGQALSKRDIKAQVEYDSAYNLLERFVGETEADNWAYTYATAPPILKKTIRNKIKKAVKDGGFS
jgi:hypothetical protein